MPSEPSITTPEEQPPRDRDQRRTLRHNVRMGLTRAEEAVVRRTGWPEEDPARIKMVLNDLILHLHPPRVEARALRFTYTFGLGGAAILLVLVQVLTGVLLMFAYTPSVEEAYRSIVALETQVWFGQLIRNLHHWSANLLVVVAFLHMLRVFYTAAFRRPRRFNWELGLTLLGLVILANFTGYLLPWDQLSYWAVTVATSLLSFIPLIGETLRQLLLGGPEIGAATLTNFYALHVMLVPLAFLGVGVYHIWRVRKDTFSTPRRVSEQGPVEPRRVTTLPHLISRELVFALALLAVLLAWATFVDAPLLGPADPNTPPDPTKSAWYFAGLQELLFHFHPDFGAFVIPALAVGTLIALPYLRDGEDVTGIWFRSVRGRWLVLISFVLGALATVGMVWLNDGVGLWQVLPFLPAWISQGVLPVAAILLGLAGYGWLLRRLGVPVGEIRMALFTLLLAAFVVLTVIGIGFRGAEMALQVPWEVTP